MSFLKLLLSKNRLHHRCVAVSLIRFFGSYLGNPKKQLYQDYCQSLERRSVIKVINNRSCKNSHEFNFYKP